MSEKPKRAIKLNVINEPKDSYTGGKSSLCPGCGHDQISNVIINYAIFYGSIFLLGHTAPSLAFAFLSHIVITDTSDSIPMEEDTTSFTPMVILAWVSPIVIAPFALMVAFDE